MKGNTMTTASTAYTDEHLEKMLTSKDRSERAICAEHGYRLDILVNDPSWRVRSAVARQGHSLDKLAHDPEWRVRAAVAKQGVHLEELMNDPVDYVRKVAALAAKAKG